MNTEPKIIPVILSGGSGTRLWPVSRADFPKQFVPLLPPDGRSLFTETVNRLTPLGEPWTVTTAKLKVLTERALRAYGGELNKQVLLEPRGRNTAPAIALITKVLLDRGEGNSIAAVFPADHLIQDEAGVAPSGLSEAGGAGASASASGVGATSTSSVGAGAGSGGGSSSVGTPIGVTTGAGSRAEPTASPGSRPGAAASARALPVANAGFQAAVRLAAKIAHEKGDVVTLGVKPTHAATGYGYIETESASSTLASPNQPAALTALNALGFREKPTAEKASEYVASGRYLWNAGMFVFKVSEMAQLLERYVPEVWAPFQHLKSDLTNLAEIYERVPSISIDYAVMEKLKGHTTVPCPFRWSDVGSWDAIAENLELARPIEDRSSGASGNLVFSQRIAVSSGSASVSAPATAAPAAAAGTAARTIAIVGVSDLIVVDTEDALLITKKGHSEKVKAVTESLEKSPEPTQRAKATAHTFETRPWGTFEILRDTEKFKSKVITVDPGAQISYQSHAKRAEHWIIVSGHGEVVLNDEVIPIGPGSHVHIPQGAKHRIRNTGASEPIVFVEVQLGTYFGEDDIVRYEDVYGR